MQCTAGICDFLLILSTLCCLIPMTIVFAAMSSACLTVLEWLWNKLLRFDTSTDPETTQYARRKIMREFLITLTSLVMLAVAMVIGKGGRDRLESA